jgi:hypothetical protein
MLKGRQSRAELGQSELRIHMIGPLHPITGTYGATDELQREVLFVGHSRRGEETNRWREVVPSALAPSDVSGTLCSLWGLEWNAVLGTWIGGAPRAA